MMSMPAGVGAAADAGVWSEPPDAFQSHLLRECVVALRKGGGCLPARAIAQCIKVWVT